MREFHRLKSSFHGALTTPIVASTSLLAKAFIARRPEYPYKSPAPVQAARECQTVAAY